MYDFKKYDLGQVTLIGENTRELPMWSINYFLQEYCNNYSKLLIIQRICELSQQGIPDKCIFVAKKSADLFPKDSFTNTFQNYNNYDYVVLSEKEEDPEKFWHITLNYVRPIVFYRDCGTSYPIYDFTYDEAIKISRLTYNSPINFDVHGVIDSLIDLAQAPAKQQMYEEEHIARQIEQLADNYNEIARASQTINDPRTSDGIRNYANQGLAQLMKKQGQLNEKLGIRIDRIDSRI